MRGLFFAVRHFSGWIAVCVIALAYYFVAVRPSLQFTAPLAFVGWTAIAALALTGVYWLQVLERPSGDDNDDHESKDS